MDFSHINNTLRGLITENNQSEVKKLIDHINILVEFISESEIENFRLRRKLERNVKNILLLEKFNEDEKLDGIGLKNMITHLTTNIND
jgi:hypothetical protein